MKSNELRVGNFVYSELVDDKIVVSTVFLTASYDQLKPIELTEEWLIKFGFKPDFQGNYEEAYIVSKFYEGFYFVDDRLGNFNVKPIHYVHEFQNLYFALTGVELQLSSNVA
jgi:hypothetical protein